MTKSIPTLAAAFLMTAIATPVFARAAIRERSPAAYSFYGPTPTCFGRRPAYPVVRSRSNAYYDCNAITTVPCLRDRGCGRGRSRLRHHRRAR